MGRCLTQSVSLLGAVVVSLLVGCCSNEVLAEHLSPDGQWKYVSFDRNCGATVGGNLQISILPASKRLPNEGGNVFIADDNHGATAFLAGAEWISARKLQIAYSPKARVFKKNTTFESIQIEYVEQQSPVIR